MPPGMAVVRQKRERRPRFSGTKVETCVVSVGRPL